MVISKQKGLEEIYVLFGEIESNLMKVTVTLDPLNLTMDQQHYHTLIAEVMGNLLEDDGADSDYVVNHCLANTLFRSTK